MTRSFTWLAMLGVVASHAACATDLGDTSSLQQGVHFRGAAFIRPPTYSTTLNQSCGRDCTPDEIAAANGATPTCADGSESETCPVSDYDWSAFDRPTRKALDAVMLQDTLPVLIAGDLVLGGRGRLRDSPILAGQIAWAGVSSDPIDGLVFSVEAASLSCGGSCGMHAELLNWPDTAELAGLDLSRVALDADALAAAEAAAAEGLLLVEGRLGPDAILSATQVLVPVAVADGALAEP